MILENRCDAIRYKIFINESYQIDKLPFINEMKKIGIEDLPYTYSAVERFIDSETMDVHYNKHYKGYVDKLNNALENLSKDDADLEDIVKNISRYSKDVRNNAGGAFNHALFWKMLSPKTQRVKGEILKKIKDDFGSYDEFKTKFEESAASRFGSGWVWLVINRQKKLKIVTTPNQDNPIMNVIKNGGYPLLGLDLWEHAYYLKYRNKRADYIKNFWSVVNWDFVNKLLSDFISKNENKVNRKVIREQKFNDPCMTKNFKGRVYRNLSYKQRKDYKETIEGILKNNLTEYYQEKDSLFEGQTSGYYDLEGEGRSVINYANTNYKVMCMLISIMNRYLKQNKWETLKFDPSDKKSFDRSFYRFIGLLKKNGSEISSGWILDKMIETLKSTAKVGERFENSFIEKLREIIGSHGVVEKVGGLGNSEDMSGTDAVIDLGEGEKTIQIKPFSGVERLEEGYVIKGSASVQNYYTDYMGFISNSKNLMLFKTSGMKLKNGQYFFPKDNMVIS